MLTKSQTREVSKQDTDNMKLPTVIVLSNGYREASINGARLIVRENGSESWANVKPDSGLYAALNAALFS